jgi:hypothetical protein
MPTVSKKQERFMQAVAHNPKFAKTVGVPTKVGKEFTKSGDTMASKMNPGFMAMMKKKAPAKKMALGGATSMGKVKTAAPSKDGVAVKGKTKGKMITMKSGGKTC